VLSRLASRLCVEYSVEYSVELVEARAQGARAHLTLPYCALHVAPRSALTGTSDALAAAERIGNCLLRI
jgi:hypothetical protein